MAYEYKKRETKREKDSERKIKRAWEEDREGKIKRAQEEEREREKMYFIRTNYLLHILKCLYNLIYEVYLSPGSSIPFTRILSFSSTAAFKLCGYHAGMQGTILIP